MLEFAARMSQLGTDSAFEVLSRAKALEAKGRSIIHLGIGHTTRFHFKRWFQIIHRLFKDL